jgi:hypothetical protein
MSVKSERCHVVISGMLGQFAVMKGGTANDSIHAIATDSKNSLLITGDTTGWVSVRETVTKAEIRLVSIS